MAPDTRWTFFTLICCKICIVCLKRQKINEKGPRITYKKPLTFYMGQSSSSTYNTYITSCSCTCRATRSDRTTRRTGSTWSPCFRSYASATSNPVIPDDVQGRPAIPTPTPTTASTTTPSIGTCVSGGRSPSGGRHSRGCRSCSTRRR